MEWKGISSGLALRPSLYNGQERQKSTTPTGTARRLRTTQTGAWQYHGSHGILSTCLGVVCVVRCLKPALALDILAFDACLIGMIGNACSHTLDGRSCITLGAAVMDKMIWMCDGHLQWEMLQFDETDEALNVETSGQ